jgi:hypothetical protein
VLQFVKALRYKPEDRGLDSRWCHWNFGTGRDSASNGNEYQEYIVGGGGGKYGRCVRLTTLPPSCADCLEIWEPQPRGAFRASPGLFRDYFTFLRLDIIYKSVCQFSRAVVLAFTGWYAEVRRTNLRH